MEQPVPGNRFGHIWHRTQTIVRAFHEKLPTLLVCGLIFKFKYGNVTVVVTVENYFAVNKAILDDVLNALHVHLLSNH